MSDHLELLWPYMPKGIIAKDYYHCILRNFRDYPLFNGGFECRLSENDDQVDFSFCIDKGDNRLDLISQKKDYRDLLNDLYNDKIIKILNQLKTEHSAISEMVSRIWFEFDFEKQKINDRRIFVICSGNKENIFNEKTNSKRAIQSIIDCLKILYKDAEVSPIIDEINRIGDKIVYPSHFFSFGSSIMDNRPEKLKLEIINLESDQLFDMFPLSNQGYKYDKIQSIISKIKSLSDMNIISINIIRGKISKLGCSASYYKKKQPYQDTRWPDLFNYLVSLNLCCKNKKDALLKYPGIIKAKAGFVPKPEKIKPTH